jgi:hypothetical protein
MRLTLTASVFEHLPQLFLLKGEKVPVHEALNLLLLCNLFMLSNALNPATYLDDTSLDKQAMNASFDFNSFSFKHRRAIWRCRAVCLNIFRWFRQYYTMRKEGVEVNLVSFYLIHQASAILRYKHEVDQTECPSTDGCTVANLAKQIDAAFEVDEATHRGWVSRCTRQGHGVDKRLSSEYLLLQDIERYEIICHESVEAWGSSTFREVLTTLDRKYLAGQEWTVKVEKKALASFPL